jgi:hypothetical protein
MSILSDVRADTSNILADWEETNCWERNIPGVPSTAGETRLTFATNLVTAGDWQSVDVRFATRAHRTVGGMELRPEFQVYLRATADVKEGDRTRRDYDGELYYVKIVAADEDKTVLTVGRMGREA